VLSPPPTICHLFPSLMAAPVLLARLWEGLYREPPLFTMLALQEQWEDFLIWVYPASMIDSHGVKRSRKWLGCQECHVRKAFHRFPR
jgi:hypothetical protein